MGDIELNFDEALYLYEQLRSFRIGPVFPDYREPEDIHKQVEEHNERFTEHQMTDDEYCKFLVKGWDEDHEWRDMEFYARIVPKLLKAYPELLRMRNQSI